MTIAYDSIADLLTPKIAKKQHRREFPHLPSSAVTETKKGGKRSVSDLCMVVNLIRITEFNAHFGNSDRFFEVFLLSASTYKVNELLNTVNDFPHI